MTRAPVTDMLSAGILSAGRPASGEGPADIAVHASCVLIGESAVLLRGPAGSGKTTLALALIEAARAGGQLALLVGDDRIMLGVRGQRLLARPHPALAGIVERRGLGLAPQPHEPAATVGLVVDCGEEPARMPDPGELVAELAGVTLPRLTSARGAADASHVLAALALFRAP
jgi:hypothetical protein